MRRFELYKWPVTYLVLIIAIIVYINRGVLFDGADGGVMVATAEGDVDALQQGAATAGEIEGDTPDSEVALDSLAVQEIPVAAAADADDAPVAAAADDAPVITEEVLSAVPAEDVSAAASAEDASAAPAEEVPIAVPSEGVSVAAPADAAPVAIAAPMAQGGVSPPAVEAAQLWQQARAQVWAGDYPQAIELYRQLLVQQPDNIDAHGELGDIYLGMRRYEEAGSSYLEAGRLLIAAGYARHAGRLMPMLNDIAPEKAAELQRLLWPQPDTVGRMP